MSKQRSDWVGVIAAAGVAAARHTEAAAGARGERRRLPRCRHSPGHSPGMQSRDERAAFTMTYQPEEAGSRAGVSGLIGSKSLGEREGFPKVEEALSPLSDLLPFSGE